MSSIPIGSVTDAARAVVPEGETIELPVGSRVVALRLFARSGPAPLSDLVPLACQIADRIVEAVREEAEGRGLRVPCAERCPACCRYLVPVSPPEAFRIRARVFATPSEERRRILSSYIHAARHVLNDPPPEAPVGPEAVGGLETTARWYESKDLECPLLSEGLCGLYEFRPLVCREHLAACDPSDCARPDQVMGEGRLPLPVSIAEALMLTAAEIEQSEPEAILLPLALLWTQENADRDARAWPASELVRQFAKVIRQGAETLSTPSLKAPR